MRYMASLLCVVTLAGCSTTGMQGSRIEAGAPYTLSASEKSTVQEGVRSSLKDPTSPLFGAMAASKGTDGVITVCGYVNGKNSYGGYVGDKPYIGILAPASGTKTGKAAFVVAGMGGTDTDTMVTYSLCQQSGISL